MMRHILTRYSLLATIWIYSIFAAPLEGEEGMAMTENMTHSCLRDSLNSEKLKAQYDACLAENSEEEDMLKEDVVLLCVLKKEGMIVEGEGEPMETSIMKWVEPEASEETMEATEKTPLATAVEMCKANEEASSGEILPMVQCLLENLLGNCTQSLMQKEEMMMMMPMEEAAPADM